ncbi:hypothetical protein Ancab_004228 [Ancistrocladus abbreviatus]
MAGNIEHGVVNQEIVDVGITHVGDDGLGFLRAIEDIDMGGDNGENRVILKSQPKDDSASLVDINVTYFEGVNANFNTSVDVSYNTLDSDVDSDESCHRDKITNEALWSDNEEVFEVRRQKAIMEKLTEEETMKNNKNVGSTITPSSRQTLQYGVNFSRQQVGDSVSSFPMPTATCMSTHRPMLMPTPGQESILFAEAAPRPILPQSLSTPHLTGQPRIISSQSLQAHRDAKKSEITRREKLVPWKPCN